MPPLPQEHQAERREMAHRSRGIPLSDVPQVISVRDRFLLIEPTKDDQRISQIQDFAVKNNFRIASRPRNALQLRLHRSFPTQDIVRHYIFRCSPPFDYQRVTVTQPLYEVLIVCYEDTKRHTAGMRATKLTTAD